MTKIDEIEDVNLHDYALKIVKILIEKGMLLNTIAFQTWIKDDKDTMFRVEVKVKREK